MKTQRIVEQTLANGGGTFDAKTGLAVRPATGYAVGAVKGTAIKVSVENADLIGDAAKIVAKKFPDAYLGTWVSDGYVHIDPVIWVPSLEVALHLARKTQQESIWDFSNGNEIVVTHG